MTIREFKTYLETFEDDSKDIFVALFKLDGTGETFDIESVSDNNGHIQLNIEEI